MRADGVRGKFLRGPTAMQELIEPMITGKPYPIRALVIYGTSLLHTLPDVGRTLEALKRLDLVLTVDVLPQDHVAWSDVVLPEAVSLERYDDLWACGHKTPYIALREPAVEPLGECKPGWWIARELGLRLELAAWFPWKTAEEYLNQRLSSVGLTLDDLRAQEGIALQKGKPWLAEFEAQGTSPFGTLSKKIELHSAALAKAGHDPLPVYRPTPGPPAGGFRLLYGRSPLHTFGRTQNNPILADLEPHNSLWIHPRPAAALGLREGDPVLVRNGHGDATGPLPAKLTERMPEDAVYMVHGFGHRAPGLTRANGRGGDDTAVIRGYALDAISGATGMRTEMVTVQRAGAGRS